MTEISLINNRVFTYWEGPKPDYIDLCHQTIRKANGNCFTVLTPESVGEYIDIPYYYYDDHYDYWNSLMPAHRADLIRVEVLSQFGGVWIDSDFIALNSFKPLIEASERNHALYYYHDGDRYTNGFLCAPFNHSMMIEWARNNFAVFLNLKTMGIVPSPNNRWTSFGADQLDAVREHAVDDHRDVSHRRIGPIRYRDMDRFFETENLTGTVWGAAYGYMLFNTGFPEWFKKLDRDQILEGPWMISRLFRFALGLSQNQ